jgi:hypothetical protein
MADTGFLDGSAAQRNGVDPIEKQERQQNVNKPVDSKIPVF